MIDFEDADDMATVGVLGGGGLFIVAAIIFFFIAMSNDSNCSKKSCPLDMKPKLTSHECLCVTPAK